MSEPKANLTRAQFKLEEMLVGDGNILVKYTEVIDTDQGTVKTPASKKPPIRLHKDLRDLLEQLRASCLKEYDYDKLSFDGNVGQWNDMIKDTTVYGIQTVGNKKMHGVCVKAKLETENGVKAIPSGNIIFSATELGYEQEVAAIFDSIEQECYEMLFQEKGYELTLFTKAPSGTGDAPTEEETQGVLS